MRGFVQTEVRGTGLVGSRERVACAWGRFPRNCTLVTRARFGRESVRYAGNVTVSSRVIRNSYVRLAETVRQSYVLKRGGM